MGGHASSPTIVGMLDFRERTVLIMGVHEYKLSRTILSLIRFGEPSPLTCT
jgi:hypothetical protein